jgi:hypothetical protein
VGETLAAGADLEAAQSGCVLDQPWEKLPLSMASLGLSWPLLAEARTLPWRSKANRAHGSASPASACTTCSE